MEAARSAGRAEPRARTRARSASHPAARCPGPRPAGGAPSCSAPTHAGSDGGGGRGGRARPRRARAPRAGGRGAPRPRPRRAPTRRPAPPPRAARPGRGARPRSRPPRSRGSPGARRGRRGGGADRSGRAAPSRPGSRPARWRARRAAAGAPTSRSRAPAHRPPRSPARRAGGGRGSRPARSRAASRDDSVGGRQRLRFLDLHLVVAARDAARPRLVAQDLGTAGVAQVALAELRRHGGRLAESAAAGKPVAGPSAEAFRPLTALLQPPALSRDRMRWTPADLPLSHRRRAGLSLDESIGTELRSPPTGSDNPNNVHTGFADLGNPQNPFKDWNIVFVSYCSCDVHFGDAAQDYPPHVEHRGYENARVVEKWAREHFVNPDEVFVTGSSAGAYGAWFNAPLHEGVWPASKFEVLADAGNGVITQSFLDSYFPNWNFAANVPTDIPGLTDVLTNGSGIPGYTEVVANFFPRTRWAQYSAAYDGGFGGQTSFYNIMLNDNDPIAAVTWWNASCAFNSVMRSQGSRPPPPCPRTTATTSGPDRDTRCGAATRCTPTRPAACRRPSTGWAGCWTARRRGPTASVRNACSSCRATRRPARSRRRSR